MGENVNIPTSTATENVSPVTTASKGNPGIIGKRIANVTIKVNKGTVKYQVHILGGGWLPWVTGFNWKDHHHGYAGNGKAL